MDRAIALARGCAEWTRVGTSTLEGCGLGFFVALPPGPVGQKPTAAADWTMGCSDYGVDARGTPCVKKGSFVGLYRGEWKRRRSARSYDGARKSHAMETDDFFIVPPPAATDLVNVYEYRTAAVQEVPQGEVANVVFVRWFTVGDVLEEPPAGISRKASADSVALYAARDLYDGEELFTHYGSEYPRTWVAGRCGHLVKKDILPPRLAAAYVPADAWSLV